MSWYNPEDYSSAPPAPRVPDAPPAPPAPERGPVPAPSPSPSPGRESSAPDLGVWQPRNVGLSPSFGGARPPTVPGGAVTKDKKRRFRRGGGEKLAPAPVPAPTSVGAPATPAPPPLPAAAVAASSAPGADQGVLSLSVRTITASVFGLAYLVSAWFNWLSFEGESASAYEGPLRYLVDNTADQGGPSIGVVVLVLGLAIAATAVVRRLRVVTLVAALVALAVPVLFVVQTSLLVGDLRDVGFDGGVTDFLAIGSYGALVAALGAVVAGLLSLRRPSPVGKA